MDRESMRWFGSRVVDKLPVKICFPAGVSPLFRKCLPAEDIESGEQIYSPDRFSGYLVVVFEIDKKQGSEARKDPTLIRNADIQ